LRQQRDLVLRSLKRRPQLLDLHNKLPSALNLRLVHGLLFRGSGWSLSDALDRLADRARVRRGGSQPGADRGPG